MGLVNFITFTGSAFGYCLGTFGKTAESLAFLNPVSPMYNIDDYSSFNGSFRILHR